MMMTGSQCRAARALINIRRAQLAEQSGIAVLDIERYERELDDLPEAAVTALKSALEHLGAAFIAEGERGVGVQLKFTVSDVRQVERWEDEGGFVGEALVL